MPLQNMYSVATAENSCQNFVSQNSKSKKMNMEKLLKHQEPNSNSHHFLTGAILFANLDYSGLSAYALKAVIGGAIWMAFKLVGDYLSYRLVNRHKQKNKASNPPIPENPEGK